MAKKSVSYDPGTAPVETIRQISPTTFQIDSFRGEAKSYTISLGSRPNCTCPHFTERLAELPGAFCKHITAIEAHQVAAKAERAAKYHELTLKAGSLTDDELARLIEKYRATPGPVLLCLLGEEFDRQALEVDRRAPEVAPEVAPAPVPAPRIRQFAELSEAEQKAIFA
jgi:predicted nucleic acid-binding Zn finger protein